MSGVLLDGGRHGIGLLFGMAEREFDARHTELAGHARDASVQRDPGLAPRQYLDLAPAEPDDTDAQRLSDSLLGREACRETRVGVGEAGAVGAFLRREQALASARQALEQPPHAGHREGIDAHALDVHSTVTVFARLRGWSTLSPLRRAM